ncbi:MAG: LPS export ABC transporter periplasmic protein LptC [Bacteroides sp.]|nr:LPS export ABC transporter periplasmic protein LptC [Bacteroides sp.]MDE6257472.1 LPS export ABC transporter periplasmic protein LptC [Muribaculaceae bacterium]
MIFALLLMGAGCKEEKKVDVAASLNPERMATMTTKNVSTLISDSGVIQYKIVSPIWKVFDQVDTPYWIFPDGLFLQKYDKAFHVIATVAADSARYFKDRKLWKLMGRVELTKAPKDLFQSEELYWDQKTNKIYSDSFIHIETETHVLEGIGFISNDKLTEYRVVKPMGIFPVNKDDIREGPASAPSPEQNIADNSPAVKDTVAL